MSESPPTSLPDRVEPISVTSLEEWIKQLMKASKKVEQLGARYRYLTKQLHTHPGQYEKYSGMLLTCAVKLGNAQNDFRVLQKRFDPPKNSEVTLKRTG